MLDTSRKQIVEDEINSSPTENSNQKLDVASGLEQSVNESYTINNDLDTATIKSPEYVSTVMPDVWIYDGEAYDLTDFIKKHPGGEFFIGRMKNRDITALVNIMHRNPEVIKKKLKKYALNRKATAENFHKKYNAPPFLFKDDFDGWRDTPKYDFINKSELLKNIRKRINDSTFQSKIKRMDVLFDLVTAILIILYVLAQVLRLGATDWMPIYLFAPLMALLRIGISGAGHYLNHRPMVGFNKFVSHIFDINYVPMAFVVVDGHTLMHHPYTQSDVDIKKNVFTAMMELPRFFRLPLHTVHKIGHVLTGMFIRTFEICTHAHQYGVKYLYGDWKRGLPHYLGMLFMRGLLFGECLAFALNGHLIAWLAQFVLTLWFSTFLIVASHDFEHDEIDNTIAEGADWAVCQIKAAYDLKIIGNKYIDCFLSAGLSPHRVHHVLPNQKSGFANIVSEDIVKEEASRYEIEWDPPKNFLFDRLPSMVNYYLLGPSRQAKDNNLSLYKEHFNFAAIRNSIAYIYKGFIGVGSI